MNWLLKTEPDVFSFSDLVNAPRRTTTWEGVRNYQARNFMRDQFQVGDSVLIYHSNTDEPAVVGIAEVARAAAPDRFAMDPKHRYFDSDAAKKGVNPWVMVEVTATHRLLHPVNRKMLAADQRLAKMMVLQKGSRLSVQPVTDEEFAVVCELGKREALERAR